ncbi:hypothetical protein BV20DRAFT_973867 [Pilatotrama ljubarskyi]|nr:hypothetical protein BV20DRAFT_973867 [Pilatotrama ljubarskyi]
MLGVHAHPLSAVLPHQDTSGPPYPRHLRRKRIWSTSRGVLCTAPTAGLFSTTLTAYLPLPGLGDALVEDAATT